MSLTNYKKQIQSAVKELNDASTILKAEQSALDMCKDKAEAYKEAQEIVQELVATIQQQAHHQIANVVSKCLQLVFEEPYTFKIEFHRKRGKTEAALSFERNGECVDPLSASGGGVVDVAAFALRLSCVLLSKPQARPLLVLDEPFKFVSAEYISNVKNMLEVLSNETGVQFVIVTHLRELQLGTIIDLRA